MQYRSCFDDCCSSVDKKSIADSSISSPVMSISSTWCMSDTGNLPTGNSLIWIIFFLFTAVVNVVNGMQGFKSWGIWGGIYPWKYVGGVRVCFDPRSFTFFHWKLLLDNSACFISLRMKDPCRKWKVKLIFWGTSNSLMAWPDWPWPPYFRTDLHHW